MLAVFVGVVEVFVGGFAPRSSASENTSKPSCSFLGVVRLLGGIAGSAQACDQKIVAAAVFGATLLSCPYGFDAGHRR